MAIVPITVRKPWELIALIKDKSHLIHLHLSNCPSLDALALEDLGSEITRMGELLVGLREAIAALPKAPVVPVAQERRRA